MRRVAFLPAALLLVAACATSQPSPTPTAIPPTSSSPVAVATPSPSPVATPSPSVAPTVTPVPTKAPSPLTADQQKLVAMLRPDAAIDCASRRNDLPEGTLYAIECHPDDPLVASVGVYWLPTENEATYAYMTRLASYDIPLATGDCVHDKPGDAAWAPGDGVGNWDDPGVFNWENSPMSPSRNGCFRNENGIANARATCGNAYVGVLGTKKDLSDLYAWMRTYPAGAAHDTPEPPGICVSGS